MDWTPIIVALINNAPAIIGAIGGVIAAAAGVIAAIKSHRASAKVDANTDITVKGMNKLSRKVDANTDITAQQGEAISGVAGKTDTIAKAVNGDLDRRFKRIEETQATVQCTLNAIKKHLGMNEEPPRQPLSDSL